MKQTLYGRMLSHCQQAQQQQDWKRVRYWNAHMRKLAMLMHS